MHSFYCIQDKKVNKQTFRTATFKLNLNLTIEIFKSTIKNCLQRIHFDVNKKILRTASFNYRIYN